MKYLVILLLFVEFSAGAQDTSSCPCQKELYEAFAPNLKGQIYRGIPGIVGTEFFNPSYQKADIILEQGGIVKDQMVRYNGRIDGILVSPPNSGKEILLDKYFVRGFRFIGPEGPDQVSFSKIRIVNGMRGDSTMVFGQVLYQNKLSLYAYRRYSYIDDVQTDVADVKIAKKEFGPSFVYYFRLPNGRSVGFRSFKKRDLYKLFPGDKELMKKLFREKHQRHFRNENDLIRITEILNSLYK